MGSGIRWKPVAGIAACIAVAAFLYATVTVTHLGGTTEYRWHFEVLK